MELIEQAAHQAGLLRVAVSSLEIRPQVET